MHDVTIVFRAKLKNPNPPHYYDPSSEELEQKIAKAIEANAESFYLDTAQKRGMFQRDFFRQGFTVQVHVRKHGAIGRLSYLIRRFFESIPPCDAFPHNLAEIQSDSARPSA